MNNLLIAFDLDDTLYKEVDFVMSAYRYIARQMTEAHFADVNLEKEISDAMSTTFLSGGDAFAVANTIAGSDIPVSRFLDWYRYHLPDISLQPEISRTLSVLKEKGNRLALITDGRSRTQRNKILALNLSDLIMPEDIIISEEFGSEKPDERNYRYFSDRYPDAAGYVYVGDNVRKDFIAPNKLGWKTIGVRDNGKNIHSQNVAVDNEYMPKIWIDSVAGLEEIL